MGFDKKCKYPTIFTEILRQGILPKLSCSQSTFSFQYIFSYTANKGDMLFRASFRMMAAVRTQLAKPMMARPVFPSSSFHTSRASLLLVGDKYHPFPLLLTLRLPPHTLMEKGPTDRIDLSKELGNRKTLIMFVAIH